MQFCCSAPNNSTEHVINTGEFAFHKRDVFCDVGMQSFLHFMCCWGFCHQQGLSLCCLPIVEQYYYILWISVSKWDSIDSRRSRILFLMISSMEAQGYYCLWHLCSCLYLFMHLGLCRLLQKVMLITVFHNKWDHFVNRTAGKISRYGKWTEKEKKSEKMQIGDRLHDSVLHVCLWIF